MNNQNQVCDNQFENMMRFDSNLVCPMILPTENYTVDTLDINSKDNQLHSTLNFGRPIMELESIQSPFSDSHSLQSSIAMDNNFFTDPVYESFICERLDTHMTPETSYNPFKDTLPRFTDLTSTVLSGYNYDMDLTVGSEGQQCFNSGATTSSLMCFVTQNTVLPERSGSLLPDLESPDEFISSDEDNISATDDQDCKLSKIMRNQKNIVDKSMKVEDIAAESHCRQVEHKKEKNQQMVKQLDLSPIEKNEKSCTRKNKVFYDDQNEKRTRKNYGKDVINTLMSWYLIHNGQIPDSGTKAKICRETGKSLVQISTWFQNAKRRYYHKLQVYNSYSKTRPDLVYDSESFEAFLRSGNV